MYSSRWDLPAWLGSWVYGYNLYLVQCQFFPHLEHKKLGFLKAANYSILRMMINASSQPLVQVVSHLKRASSFLFANLGFWITAFEVMLHYVLKAFS